MNSDVLGGEYFDLETYQVFRKDRKGQNAPGGGVLIMVRRTLLSFDDKANFLNNHQYKESVWCKIRLRSKCLLAGVTYRPPNCSREQNLVK